jgi:hypothetical protein
MSQKPENLRAITLRKNFPALPSTEGAFQDTPSAWRDAYFAVEVTRVESSQRVQQPA